MTPQQLGKTGLLVSPIGFGAFKIGRNQKIKYPQPYDLPDEAAVDRLLNGLLDLGVRYIDTAPAYGLSEERIGRAISHRRDEFVLSTKVGETFEDGRSVYDFSEQAVLDSVSRSLTRLRLDALDMVFVHAHGNDLQILRETAVVATLQDLKSRGLIRAIGFSGKTPQAACESLDWADAVMVEYHRDDTSHAAVIEEASRRRIGVVVKKGLASGNLPVAQALQFVLSNPHVDSVIVGGLNLDHMRDNIAVATHTERT